ncbi:hypothetical protein ACJ41O_006196 [Fusarium nematophilum]
MKPSFSSAFTILGAATALSLSWKLSRFLWLYIRPSSFSRYAKTAEGSPPWAFITGASSGIGRAFAFELASRGFNIILHARNRTKLDSVKEALQAKFPDRAVRIIVADASDPSKVDFSQIAQSVSDVQLKVLINNVGSTMPFDHEFDTVENYSAQELLANVGANATFPLALTGALLPNMLRDQPGLILNIGSFADIGMPLFPSYAPSKAFMMTSCVELGLEMEFKMRDIEVLGLRIIQVTDTGVIFLPTSFSVPTATKWVKSALARVGCGRPHVVPFLPQALQMVAMNALPDWLAKQLKISLSASLLEGDPMGRIAAEAAKAAKKKL